MSGTTQEPEIERVSCNLCGDDAADELYRCKDYRFQVDSREWPVVRCRGCGLAYLNPRPTRDAIGRYYPEEFFGGRSRDALAERYRIQTEYLQGVPPGQLLDVGCANGDWMQLMAERGWTVFGLEPSENAQNPHGLEIRRGSFPEGADFAPGSFDAITAWAVFEHLHDPLAAFRRASELLRPGGRLIALVTNINSLFSRYSYREDVPRHLYFFSEQSLARFGHAASLRLVSVAHDTRLYGGAGRGTLGAQLWKRLGRPLEDYFRHRRRPIRDRLTSEPLLGTITLGVAALERVAFTDTLARVARVNGHIVATLQKD
ncbi:MAG: class I SAM-dependent methyltransferase [Myxococcota bacterium]|nr:class I SAM-dependent methyltransferase [Myxococcota bacterium]